MGILELCWADSPENNGISDNVDFVSYKTMQKWFYNFDKYFDGYKTRISCVFLEVDNSIYAAVCMLYLMNRGINVHIASPNTLNSGVVPDFCDLILKPREKSLSDGADPVLKANDNYVTGGIPGQRHGMVILASSGSSAIPKYIYYQTIHIFKNAEVCIPHFQIRDFNKVLVTVPVCHMYGLGAGFLPSVMCGAQVSILNRPNVISVIDRLRSFQPDFCLINPTISKMLLQVSKASSAHPIYLSAGEPLDAAVATEFSIRYGHLINLYGCSELGAMATSAIRAQGLPSSGERPLTPVDGVEFMISTNGDTREILCKSEWMFEYYLDEKGEKMPEQPFENGWYKTKDVGDLDNQGHLLVAGRIDFCVNRSGFLLSLEELGLRLEKLLDAAAFIVPIETQTGELIACCELHPAAVLDNVTARNICLKCLPRYTVPDRFVFFQPIPRLFNGKPDRLALKNIIHKNQYEYDGK